MSLLMFEDVFSFVRGKDGGYVSKEVSGVRMCLLVCGSRRSPLETGGSSARQSLLSLFIVVYEVR